MRRLSIILMLAALAGLMGCGKEPEKEKQTKLTQEAHISVVATTATIADIVVNVGGHLVDVSLLIPPEADPHLFRPSREDIRLMADADVVLYNGLNLEEFMSDELTRLESRVRMEAVTAGMSPALLLRTGDREDVFDPHVWHDVRLWMMAVEHVRNVFMQVDPVYAEMYASNAEIYLEQMADLHDFVHAQTSALPVEQRVLVTAHDAFRYFGRAYGFNVIGLAPVSTASGLDPGRVNSVVRFAAGHKVPAVFPEVSVPVLGMETLSAALGDAGIPVEIARPLYSDGLGLPGTRAGTYIEMVRHNTEVITSVLGNQGKIRVP